MRDRIQTTAASSQQSAIRGLLLLALLASGLTLLAADFRSQCADRAAIESVYYNHRLGEKPPFAQALPSATLENLVRQDLRKETALKKFYGVEVTPALLDAEVRRINSATRASEMLAEIKAALNNDPERLADSFAKPFVVERLLRDKFNDDDALHAPQRRQIERTRNELLSARTNGADPGKLLALLKRSHSNAVAQTTWQLTARSAETNGPSADELAIRKQFGPNAQLLSSPPAAGKDQKSYFQDLPPDLQNVLLVQLRQPGDISAVIEMPVGFLLCVSKERTETILSVAMLSIPKCSYEQWLETQSENDL